MLKQEKKRPKKIIKKIVLEKSWPEDAKDFRNFISASIIIFLALISIIYLLVFFSFSLVKLTNGFRVLNQAQTEINQGDQIKELSDYLYYAEKQESEIIKEDFLDKNLELRVEEFMSLPDLNLENTLRSQASPDGSKLATVVKMDNKEAVLVNGKLGPFYEAITFMLFSPDSKNFAYGAKTNYQELVILNGKEGRLYDWVFSPFIFSPDSKYFIYKSRNSNGYFLVFNQTETDSYDYVYEPFVSEDKSTLIFYSRRGDKVFKNSLKLW